MGLREMSTAGACYALSFQHFIFVYFSRIYVLHIHLPSPATLTPPLSVSFNGLAVQVDSYEFLVPALHPVRYSSPPNVPRMLGETKDVPGVKRLNLIKTVVLVDDSASMAPLDSASVWPFILTVDLSGMFS
ncbi:hypothetical protein Hypma_014625 [Hypsizygus marmoreus]|uniref:Uncharacterized protein n=1 Tax=Hypsizygus marmoreus TaxID=39966 RepID=A0A369JBQ8_HYPMA|nr:hypothetical protein Hypma_014625 [Hypsizygus marmoreus]